MKNNPVKLLKGYKKVFVKTGEKIAVELVVEKDDLRFYDEKSKKWYLDNSYNIFVGEDSEKANLLTVEIIL